MISFIDTHCHLDQILEQLKLTTYAELKQRYFPPEFRSCVTISCESNSLDPTLALLSEPDVYASFGMHPHESKDYQPEIVERIAAALQHPKCVAYGEIGLDYHYDHAPRELQREVFAKQIAVGVGAGKPLIIHTREAEDDSLSILRDALPRHWPVHVHCFTSSSSLADSLLADFSNLHIGFTGIVTFKNSESVRDVVRLVPLERMLVETDGPYLAPEPYRGKVAHPGHIPGIIDKLAEIKQKPREETAAVLLRNAQNFYGI